MVNVHFWNGVWSNDVPMTPHSGTKLGEMMTPPQTAEESIDRRWWIKHLKNLEDKHYVDLDHKDCGLIAVELENSIPLSLINSIQVKIERDCNEMIMNMILRQDIDLARKFKNKIIATCKEAKGVK